MENYQMSRFYDRPYHRTCGCAPGDSCPLPSPAQTQTVSDTRIDQALAPLPKAMAYVPDQPLTTTYGLKEALRAGTIFPQLYKPFCGKRGGCR